MVGLILDPRGHHLAQGGFRHDAKHARRLLRHAGANGFIERCSNANNRRQFDRHRTPSQCEVLVSWWRDVIVWRKKQQALNGGVPAVPPVQMPRP